MNGPDRMGRDHGPRVAWWRLWSVQGSFEPAGQQWSGWMVCLAPWLRRRFDRGGLQEWMAQEPLSVNTNPYLFGLLVGARLRVEEEHGPELGRRVTAGLQSALGALGDALVWSAWRPFAALLAGILGLAAGLVPVLGVWIAFAAAQSWLRGWGLRWGFEHGLDVASELGRLDLRAHTRRVRIAGAVAAGLLAALLGLPQVVDATAAAGWAALAALAAGSVVAARNARGEWAIGGAALSLWVLSRTGILAG